MTPGSRAKRAASGSLRLVLLLMLPALAGAGCGYTSRRLSDFPAARTIAVEPFENTGYRRDLELRLTQAVLTEIRARSDLGIASPSVADLVLSGRADLNQQLLVLGPDLAADQYRLFGTVQVTLTDRRSGAVLRERSVSDRDEIRPGEFGESIEGSGIDEWTRRVAVRIVQILEPGL